MELGEKADKSMHDSQQRQVKHYTSILVGRVPTVAEIVRADGTVEVMLVTLMEEDSFMVAVAVVQLTLEEEVRGSIIG